MMNDFEVVPAFSSPIFVSFIDKNFDHLFEHMINNENIKKTNYGYDSEVSEDHRLLEKYEPIKQEVNRKFLQYKNDVLKLQSSNFKMSTSWIAKIPPGSSSQKHFHTNSYFSGVLYISSHSEDSPLIFFNPNERLNSILINDASEYNVLNSNTWKILPERNKIIFFPSYLEHKVNENKSSIDRYSIAFNFFPFGSLGDDDSFIKLNF